MDFITIQVNKLGEEKTLKPRSPAPMSRNQGRVSTRSVYILILTEKVICLVSLLTFLEYYLYFNLHSHLSFFNGPSLNGFTFRNLLL